MCLTIGCHADILYRIMPRRKNQIDTLSPDARYHFWLRAELLDLARETAAARDESVSGVIRRALAEYVNRPDLAETRKPGKPRKA